MIVIGSGQNKKKILPKVLPMLSPPLLFKLKTKNYAAKYGWAHFKLAGKAMSSLCSSNCSSYNCPFHLYGAPSNSPSFLLLTSRVIWLLENKTQPSTDSIPKYFQEWIVSPSNIHYKHCYSIRERKVIFSLLTDQSSLPYKNFVSDFAR